MSYSAIFSKNIPANSFKAYFLLGLCFACLFSLFMGSYPLLIPDEGRYAEVAREMIANQDYITPTVNGIYFFDKPILFYWFEVIMMKLFGLHEGAVRAVPMLLGVFGCLMTYHVGRVLYSLRVGVLGSAVLATSVLYFLSAHYVNMDLMVASFLTGALGLFICSWKYPAGLQRNLHLYGAYVCSGLAILTKGLIGIVFPMLIIGAWILLLNRWSVLKQMRILTGALILIVIVAPWFIMIEKARPGFFHFFFVIQHFERFTSTNFNNQHGIWFYPAVILFGFIPWSIFLFSSLKYTIKSVFAASEQKETTLYLLLWAAIVLVFFSIPASKLIGYILPVVPPLALLVARYLEELLINKTNVLKIHILILQFFSFLVAVFLLLLPSLGIRVIPESLTVFFYGIGTVLLLEAILCWHIIKRYRANIGLYFVVIAMSFNLILILLAVPNAGLSSTKSIAQELNLYLKPSDTLVSYYGYFQDLPFYTQRNVVMVASSDDPNKFYGDGWEGQLAYGLRIQTDMRQKLLMNSASFWQLWRSKQRVFVVMTLQHYASVENSKQYRFYPVAQNRDFIALCNQNPTVTK